MRPGVYQTWHDALGGIVLVLAGVATYWVVWIAIGWML
jgi:hypothetical protein